MTRISDTEKAAGKRADFHVYYRRSGKLYFDPIWAPGEDQAKAKMLGFAKELGWKIKIVRVDKILPDA